MEFSIKSFKGSLLPVNKQFFDELTKIVENLNRELNTKARQKRKETQEKYDLFDFEKAHNDRKYDFLTTDGYLKTQTK